jgi:circadian clock protein KaiC
MTQSEPGLIVKSLTGIPGFDEITHGGLPQNRTTLVAGGPGTGKTVFALQALVNGARLYCEPGIFVAFEENSVQIKENAASFGWNLAELERKNLFFLDGRLLTSAYQTGNFDLTGFLASISAKAREMSARRIVFDSIGVMLTMLNDVRAERLELYRLHDWLAESGLTGIVTARQSENEDDDIQRYTFLQYMADATIMLYQKVEDRVAHRSLRVIKYRGSGFAENEIPLVFGPDGIQAASWSEHQPDFPALVNRVSTGVDQLDAMLEGGYFAGSSVLITGAPGTAKSTLCAAFVERACRNGQVAIYNSFDESPAEITRNMASLGLDLRSTIDEGRLHIFASRADSQNAESHLLTMRRQIELYNPSYMVVDPVSALIVAGGDIASQAMVKSLIAICKSRGITLLTTSLLEGDDPQRESALLSISTIADTWIHLSYMAQRRERNGALTIVKSRGTAHSNQVRELGLSREGITLTDVYISGGEVLMGTLRWERETADAQEKRRQRRDLEKRRS